MHYVYNVYTYLSLVNFIFPEEERFITDRNTYSMVSKTRYINLLSQGNSGWVMTKNNLLVKSREQCA